MIQRAQWHDLSFYSLCVFAVLAVEQVASHWNWICWVAAIQILKANGKPDEDSQTVYGVGHAHRHSGRNHGQPDRRGVHRGKAAATE